MSQQYFIGFDLGGTKMLALVMDQDYHVLGRCKTKTPAAESPQELLAAMVDTIQGAMADAGILEKKIECIAIGSPGPLDSKSGRILSTPNLGSKDFPVCELLHAVFQVPVMLDNDVNAGTWGEYKFGVARDLRHVLGVSPGTGVGGAIILDGHLFRGARGFAGELGHMIIQYEGPRCGCGLRGDLESLCSRSSLAKEAVHIAATGRSAVLAEKAGTDFKKVKSSALAKAYAEGEIEIVKLINRSAEMLGVGLGNLCTLFDPDAIVIGGGLVEKLGKGYLKRIKDSMSRHSANPAVNEVSLLLSSLGDDAVAKGAVSLYRENECVVAVGGDL